jgi:hypothetical protein
MVAMFVNGFRVAIIIEKTRTLRFPSGLYCMLYYWIYKVYSIQHYVIKFISDLRQVGGFSGYSGFLHY